MDLNLIRPFCVLLEERHVSRAAERYDVSQPTMSRLLDRMRVTFKDELLVRNGGRFETTPRAQRLLTELPAVPFSGDCFGSNSKAIAMAWR
jgi:DNA-binding transcriptional LysR family regulator